MRHILNNLYADKESRMVNFLKSAQRSREELKCVSGQLTVLPELQLSMTLRFRSGGSYPDYITWDNLRSTMPGGRRAMRCPKNSSFHSLILNARSRAWPPSPRGSPSRLAAFLAVVLVVLMGSASGWKNRNFAIVPTQQLTAIDKGFSRRIYRRESG